MKATIKAAILTNCLFALLPIVAHSGAIDFYYNRQLEKTTKLTLREANNIEEHTYQQWIDHDQPALGTFAQRYYLDESLSTSNNDPVFFYICGESACQKTALSGAIRTLATKYHAKLVALEHRYYGKSSPYSSLTTEHLRYLTIDNALNDLARFQNDITKEHRWTGKWVAFGGSYPGSLSAYYRLKHPELVAGSLASSAPVMAKENFEEYDAHVTSVAGPECAANMRAVVKSVDSALADDRQFTDIKRLFGAEDIRDKMDVVSLIAEIGAGAVQYGMRDMLCSKMAESKTPLDGYAEVARMIYARWEIRAVDLVAQGAESENANDYSEGIGMRQWNYQSCKEYGYWQTANADAAKSTRSPLINLDYYQNICMRLFGLSEHADTTATNASYYSPLFDESTSRIFFTNGANDPWSRLSLTEKNGNATNKNLNYYLIDGSAHCDDLHAPKVSDSVALKSARQQLDELVGKWLSTTN